MDTKQDTQTTLERPQVKATLTPYLFFAGNCEEAIEFYKEALGADVKMMMRFCDSPEPPPPGVIPEDWDDKVMHVEFEVYGNLLMASDGCSEMGKMQGFGISLSFETEEEVDRAFNALSDGAKITMPLDKTFWSPRFGSLEDKFGLGWMIGIFPQM